MYVCEIYKNSSFKAIPCGGTREVLVTRVLLVAKGPMQLRHGCQLIDFYFLLISTNQNSTIKANCDCLLPQSQLHISLMATSARYF